MLGKDNIFKNKMNKMTLITSKFGMDLNFRYTKKQNNEQRTTASKDSDKKCQRSRRSRRRRGVPKDHKGIALAPNIDSSKQTILGGEKNDEI